MIQRSHTMEGDLVQTSAARDNWLRLAEQFIRVNLARGILCRFTAGDVAALAANPSTEGIPTPPDPRRWGQVLQKAKREGLVVHYSPLGVPQYGLSKAGHRTPVWMVGNLHAAPKPKPARKGQPRIPVLTDVVVPKAAPVGVVKQGTEYAGGCAEINYDGPLPGEYRPSITSTKGPTDWMD